MRPPARSSALARDARHRRRASVIAGAGVLVSLLGPWLAPRGARACSCISPPPPAEALERADAVFAARPFSMTTDGARARYRLDVERVWKGAVEPRVEIATALQSATCGRRYEIGTSYVIYAGRSNDGEWTDNLCSRTRSMTAAAEDLGVLGEGFAPLDPNADPPGGSSPQPTEPPRIDVAPVEPPPSEPRPRGCAIDHEKPHTGAGFGLLALAGLAVAIRRRRAVPS